MANTVIRVAPFPITTPTNLIAPAGGPARFAGVWGRRGVRDEVRVAWTLRALAGARVYVVSGGARHAGGAGGLGAEGAGPAL